MNTINIYNIKIIYDEETKSSAERLRSIIEKNEMIFSDKKLKVFSLIPGIPKTYYIKDVDEFVNKYIEKYFYSEEAKPEDKKRQETMLVYIGYMLVDGFSKEKVISIYEPENDKTTKKILGDSLYKKELYEDILIKEYFDEFGSKQDFIDYIKSKDNTEELMLKIKDIYRFRTYNYILEKVVEYLKENNYFEPENMVEICKNILFKIREMTFREELDQDELDEKLKTLQKMDKKTLNNNFIEFLLEINPDGTLLRIYKDAMVKRKIKFSKKFKSSNCILIKDKVNIEIKENGTIEDFFALSHEFIHYVMNTYNKNSCPLALEEFPPIFFEKYSIDFLKKKGYKEEDLKLLHDIRSLDLRDGSFGMLSSIIADIIDKSKGKEVDGTRLRNYINTINEIIETRNSAGENIPTYDPEEYVKDEIDYRIRWYFSGLIQYIEAFRYPISSYLALNTYKQFQDDKTILNKMIEYVLYNKNKTFKDTIELFNLAEDYLNLVLEIQKGKEKQKRL